MNLNPAAVPAILLTIPLFWVGMTLQRRTQSRVLRSLFLLLGIVIAAPGFLLVTYYTHLFDNAGWFYTFRTLRFSEISLGGLGWIVGFLYSWLDPETLGGKVYGPAALLAFVSVPFIKPVLDPIDLDRLQDRCPRGVCLQTTYSTCGPASSASLLEAFGQDASEQQLARESFTSKGGTEIWYLARAFRRRGSQQTLWFSLQIMFPRPIHQLRASFSAADKVTSLRWLVKMLVRLHSLIR